MQEDLYTELVIKEEYEYTNTDESVDNITTLESTAVKQEVKEENVKTEDPLLVTIQPGNKEKNVKTEDPL